MTKNLIASVAASALFAGMTVAAPIAFAQESTQPQTMETQPLETPDATNDAAPADGTDSAETAPAAGAETTTDTAETPPAAGAETTTDTAEAPADAGGYLTEQGTDQIASSTYVGQTVYNSADESIGEISDLIFEQNGGIEAAVIGVGGFLGIGQKNVAVPFGNISIQQMPESDELKLTTTETAETLEAAPEFKTKAQQVAEQQAETPVDGSTTSSTVPATGTEPAAGTGVEPAPAQ